MPSQQKETLLSDSEPCRIFEEVFADLFSYGGKSYLVYGDRLSGWPVVADMSTEGTSTKQIIRVFWKCFSDLGVPNKLRTDGGLQFTSSEFKRFLKKYGVGHCPSSPYYPQSNGHTESMVKAMKQLVSKTADSERGIDNDDFHQGLLEYRNSPKETGISPSQMLYGHPLRSCVPAHQSSFQRKWGEIMEKYDRNHAKINDRNKHYYNAHAKDLKPLKIQTPVIVQNPITGKWDKTGIIVGVGKRRDYDVKLPSG